MTTRVNITGMIVFLVIVLSISQSSCAPYQVRRGFTEAQVLAIAGKKARAAGYNIDNYKLHAHYNFVDADNEWVVFFVPKRTVTTGEVLTVHVENSTGQAWMLPGR